MFWFKFTLAIIFGPIIITVPLVNSHSCPGLVVNSFTSLTGNFSSPSWPAPYPPDAVCHYRLQGNDWEGIKISFHFFDLEPPYKAGCLSDYLELTTVDIHGKRTFRGRYCGKALPPTILLMNPTVELIFRSNHANHHNGFFATYEFITEGLINPPTLNGTQPCGGLVTGIGGQITSPGFPIGYSAGLDCLWLIRVPYSHAIYLRIQMLEFQGSIANCGKAELGIYDGYEYDLDNGETLRRYCGDLRYYKNEEERVLLSSRNRLLIRFQTREPSKPVQTIGSQTPSPELNVGFKLIWSDVEFNTPENCSQRSRYACMEARFCFTKDHMGGASNCPDLRHYCISNELVCDNVPHCSETNASDEQNCYKDSIVIIVILVPLGILLCSISLCFLIYRRNRGILLAAITPQKKQIHMQKQQQENQGNEHSSSKETSPNTLRLALPPIMPRLPILLQNDLESPGTSDIMSPASGFSDTESMSDIGISSFLTNASGPGQHLSFCPAHGPLRILPRAFSPLPALPEVINGGSCYDGSETYDEEFGSEIYSESQNSEDTLMMINGPPPGATDWLRIRPPLHLLRRSDAVYLSDDGKSSDITDSNNSPVASHQGRICPRCLEQEEQQGSGIKQFSFPYRSIMKQSSSQVDSGIEMSIETVVLANRIDGGGSSITTTTNSSSNSTVSVSTAIATAPVPSSLRTNASIQTDFSSTNSEDNSNCGVISVSVAPCCNSIETTFGVGVSNTNSIPNANNPPNSAGSGGRAIATDV